MLRFGASPSIRILIPTLALLVRPFPAQGRTDTCNPMDRAAIAESLTMIARSTDPCGDSAEVRAVLRKVKQSPVLYRICTDVDADRNSFDRSSDKNGNVSRTITWNPELRNELELGCDGDAHKPVLRDPRASLLHELAHAAQDADGLDATQHEMDAVRIENIYRRAAGICQRAHYGNDALPVSMTKVCNPGECLCSLPAQHPRSQVVSNPPARPAPRSELLPGTVVRTSDSKH